MKTCVLDVETDDLKFTKCWVAVCRDLDTDEVAVFRNIHEKENSYALQKHLDKYNRLVGHNIFGFDVNVLVAFNIRLPRMVHDTLVISRLLNYAQEGGHSLEAWGKRFGEPKSTFSDYSRWSQELEDRCIQDTLLTSRLYKYFSRYLKDPNWEPSVTLEHLTVPLCTTLNANGFPFDITLAVTLKEELLQKVQYLQNTFQEIFPPKPKLIRTISPVQTKSGALHAKDFKWSESKDLSPYSADSPFSLFDYEPFNPNSPGQVVQRLNEAGWKPTEKTKGHIEAERLGDHAALEKYKVVGWKVSEENLLTLPDTAPEGARKLAEYLLLKSRLDDLVEWIGLYNAKTGCIHGTFNSLGSWTHRKSHNAPNMANIPSLVNRHGKTQPYGAEFRSLFTALPGKVLVGTDADGIQLRLFAHYCNDERLISAIVSGKKEEKSDIHSLNKSILDTIYIKKGKNHPLCATREVAKTYIYALLLGAGINKQASILNCSKPDALEGLEAILEFYPGWKRLKDTQLKADAKRGYFIGLDGRKVLFPSAHHILAGYLQNGESVVMKRACLMWHDVLQRMRIPFVFRNDVHDEWQTETTREHAETVAAVQMQSIEAVGRQLNLNCPLAGSRKIGLNWKETH